MGFEIACSTAHWACRRLQGSFSNKETQVDSQQASAQQAFEAEIASMALAVLVRLTANAG